MSTDSSLLQAAVRADLPWHGDATLRGTLRLEREALVLEPDGAGRRGVIPLANIMRCSVETTLGMLPVLHVWHRLAGKETLSRFEFLSTHDDDAENGFTLDLSNRVGPGLARDAASKLEGGLRALGGGLKGGRRAVRQVVEGVARQDEYKGWPSAIARAQEALTGESAAAGGRTAPSPATPPPPAPAPLIPDDAMVPHDDAATIYTWFTHDVLGWLAACGARARDLQVRGAPVISPWYPLDSPVCRIVVAGEFSRGKSTLINALFGIHGEIALPTGMTPTTPLACAIRVPHVGESDGATITYRTSRPPLHLTLDEFRASVRLEEHDPAPTTESRDLWLEEARRLEVRITGAYLPAGVEIEDTPGLNEQSARSAAAEAALGRADIVLFVLAADQLLGDLEQRVIERTLRQGHHRNVLFLVNAWDTIEDAPQRAMLRERAETLLRDFPSPLTGLSHDQGSSAPVLFISALQAQRAQRQRRAAPEESGIPQLRALLRTLLGSQATSLLLRARSGRALRYVDLLRTAVSRAGAASTTGATEDVATRRRQQYAEAVAAAMRLLASLPGAVEGATAGICAALETGSTPGAGGAVTAATQRALPIEGRAAGALAFQAVQQVTDLLIAQVRAAFLARSLPAPALEIHAAAPPLTLPVVVGTEQRWREEVVGTLQTVLRSHAERLQHLLTEQVHAVVGPELAIPPSSQALRDDERRKTAALRALEDDLVRLQQLLERCLQRADSQTSAEVGSP